MATPCIFHFTSYFVCHDNPGAYVFGIGNDCGCNEKDEEQEGDKSDNPFHIVNLFIVAYCSAEDLSNELPFIMEIFFIFFPVLKR